MSTPTEITPTILRPLAIQPIAGSPGMVKLCMVEKTKEGWRTEVVTSEMKQGVAAEIAHRCNLHEPMFDSLRGLSQGLHHGNGPAQMRELQSAAAGCLDRVKKGSPTAIGALQKRLMPDGTCEIVSVEADKRVSTIAKHVPKAIADAFVLRCNAHERLASALDGLNATAQGPSSIARIRAVEAAKSVIDSLSPATPLDAIARDTAALRQPIPQPKSAPVAGVSAPAPRKEAAGLAPFM